MNGIILVNKEKGMTSRDVINKLTSLFGIKKMGHTGTLDPLATGVLVVCIGKYTKLVDYITSYNKEYIATIKLGIKTDTEDITGNVLEEIKTPKLEKKEIINVLNSFLGKITQVVPKYSAVHVKGKRLYEYARDNEEVVLPQREVEIHEIELLKYENDEITFKVNVSKGTYIRSLITDICNKLKVIGTMSSLTRTKQGNFSLEDCVTLNDIKNNNYRLLSLEDILDLTIIDLNDKDYKKVINGNALYYELIGFVLFKKDNEEIALYNFINGEGRLIIKIK